MLSLWTKTKNAECKMSGYQTWSNIVLRDIFINDPLRSPGVLFGNASNPVAGVLFDNVVVKNPGTQPWEDQFYSCEGMEAIAMGSTTPVPPCFKTIQPKDLMA